MQPTQITVTGRFRDSHGDPEKGDVEFSHNVALVSPTEDIIISPGTIRATLDGDGEISVDLHATNDPAWSPQGWTWHVVTRFRSGGNRDYFVGIPFDAPGGTVDLADLPPVNASEGEVTYGIQSVNGHFGEHVTLTASDVNAADVFHLHDGTDIVTGTVNADRLPVGTSASTVAAGDDSRIVDAQPRSALTAKGDLYAATASGVTDRVPVGSNGQVLTAASSEDTGMHWTTPDWLPPTPVTLTDDTVIATDASLSNHFRVTLEGNRTLDEPTSPTDGQKAIWEFIQDGDGGRTITLDSVFVLGTDIDDVTLSTDPGARDFMGAIYDGDADAWFVVAFVRGY